MVPLVTRDVMDSARNRRKRWISKKRSNIDSNGLFWRDRTAPVMSSTAFAVASIETQRTRKSAVLSKDRSSSADEITFARGDRALDDGFELAHLSGPCDGRAVWRGQLPKSHRYVRDSSLRIFVENDWQRRGCLRCEFKAPEARSQRRSGEPKGQHETVPRLRQWQDRGWSLQSRECRRVASRFHRRARRSAFQARLGA